MKDRYSFRIETNNTYKECWADFIGVDETMMMIYKHAKEMGSEVVWIKDEKENIIFSR